MVLENGCKYKFYTDISYSRGLNGVGFEDFTAVVIRQDEHSVTLAKQYLGHFITINKSSIKIATSLEDTEEIYAITCGTAFRLHLTEEEIAFYKENGMKIHGYDNYSVSLVDYKTQLSKLYSGEISFGWKDDKRVWFENGSFYESGWGRKSDPVSC